MSNCYQIHKHFHGGKMKQEKLLMHLGKQMFKPYNEKKLKTMPEGEYKNNHHFCQYIHKIKSKQIMKNNNGNNQRKSMITMIYFMNKIK